MTEIVLLTKMLHDVEIEKIGLDYEVGMLLSPLGKILKVYNGKAHGIIIPDEDKPLFKGNIFTHNHPGGRTFTIQDIISCNKLETLETRVSTSDSIFFSIKESGTETNRSMGNVMKEEKVGSTETAMILLQQKIDKTENYSYGMEYQNEMLNIMGEETEKWLIANAGGFGYKYTKGVV